MGNNDFKLPWTQRQATGLEVGGMATDHRRAVVQWNTPWADTQLVSRYCLLTRRHHLELTVSRMSAWPSGAAPTPELDTPEPVNGFYQTTVRSCHFVLQYAAVHHYVYVAKGTPMDQSEDSSRGRIARLGNWALIPFLPIMWMTYSKINDQWGLVAVVIFMAGGASLVMVWSIIVLVRRVRSMQ